MSTNSRTAARAAAVMNADANESSAVVLDDKTKTAIRKIITISRPRFERATFEIEGSEVLVIHRFSAKIKNQLEQKMMAGKTAASRKTREPKDSEETYNDARYRARDADGKEWDGFHAAAIRKGMISMCKLVGYKMTLAKLSIFVEADGYDIEEPQIPLIRIIGKPRIQKDIAYVETGQPYVTIRPVYFPWRAFVRAKWDADQFTLNDITNLLWRLGEQGGIGEGRPDSKNSAGMGWGLFKLKLTKAEQAA